jgi:beta-glucosidase
MGEPILPYKDQSLAIPLRVADLVSRMTLAEKAGVLFHGMLIPGPNFALSTGHAEFSVPGTEELVVQKKLNHMNILGPVTDARKTAEWLNKVQTLAIEKTRLGIPITFSTDPRNHFTDNVGTSSRAGCLSQWPETLGFAALGDEKLVERFADIARREYLALGLRLALSPQADLSTEYRWARINATWGESADLSGKLTEAYIRGFQAPHLSGGLGLVGSQSVSTMTKHFPGAGPEKDGEDSHFTYGQDQIYPGDGFEYHLQPFRNAIAAGTRQMMPYYSKPVGLKDPKLAEEVAFGFHKGIVTTLLKEELGFKGIVCSDWGLVSDAMICGEVLKARAWGCEHLTALERVAKILNAGCDQLGGEWIPELVVQAVQQGLVSSERVDRSVEKLLLEKFELGLFDNPYVDPEQAEKIVGHPDFVREAEVAQRRSITLLTNKNDILPLSLPETQSKLVYVEGIDSDVLTGQYGLRTVESPSDADIAILRIQTPYEPRSKGFESQYHAGSLEFSAAEKQRQAAIFSSVPHSIVDIYLDRPAAVPEVFEQTTSVVANFGSNAQALLDVIFGLKGASPEGKLPFDLPSSTAAVCQSKEDLPFDTENPVFRYGHGLRYKR